jgi:hypothetical protein
VQQLKSQTELGLRWLKCGWRLFLRHPSLLGGFGLLSVAVVAVLALIPFLGRPLVALAMPVLLGGAYLSIETLIKQKPLKPSAPTLGFRDSPQALLDLLRDEKKVVPALVAGFLAMFVALLANVAFGAIVGRGWDATFYSLRPVEVAAVGLGIVLMLFIYFWLAASLVYALPLAFFNKEPLVPAIGRSLRTGARYGYALAVVLGLLLVPLLLSAVVAAFTDVIVGYVSAVLSGVVILPVVATSLYCSYRTLFQAQPTKPRAPAMPVAQRPGGVRWSNAPKRN